MTTRIGDMVHYVSRPPPDGSRPSVCQPAVVTEIGESHRRGLWVLDPAGIFFDREIEYDSPLGDAQSREPRTPASVTWHGMDECNPDGATLSRLWSGDLSGIGPVFR